MGKLFLNMSLHEISWSINKCWNYSANKLVFPQIDIKCVLKNKWHGTHERETDALTPPAKGTSCTPDLSQERNKRDWNSLYIPDCRERHQQWVRGELCLCLMGYHPRTAHPLIPKHKLEADESQWKYLKFHWKYLKLNFALSLYRRTSTQTRLRITTGVLQSSPFLTFPTSHKGHALLPLNSMAKFL